MSFNENKLKTFDAYSGAGHEYSELFEIVDVSEYGEVEELAERAVKMGGVFWSKKHHRLLFGTFGMANKLEFKEFKEKLINTLKDEQTQDTND